MVRDGKCTRTTYTVVVAQVRTLAGICAGAIDFTFETFDVGGAGRAASLWNEESSSIFREMARDASSGISCVSKCEYGGRVHTTPPGHFLQAALLSSSVNSFPSSPIHLAQRETDLITELCDDLHP